ncbi:MAG TPA: DUF4132 domain-containing protein [Chloroflexota bacterium]|jgi:hypothetical protein
MAMTSPVDAATDPRDARQLLHAYLTESDVQAHVAYLGVDPNHYASGRAILAADPAVQALVVQATLLTLAAWDAEAAKRVTQAPSLQAGLAYIGEIEARVRALAEQARQGIPAAAPAPEPAEPWAPVPVLFRSRWEGHWRLAGLLTALTRKRLPYDTAAICRVLDALAMIGTWDGLPVRGVERALPEGSLPPEVRAALGRARGAVASDRHQSAEVRKLAAQLDALLKSDQIAEVKVEIDDADDWGQAARATLAEMDAADRPAWVALLLHAATATAAKPSGVWQKEARRRIDALGEARFKALATTWLGLLKRPASSRTRPSPDGWMPVSCALFTDRNATLLKGIVWHCALLEDEALAQAVAEAADGCFHKIPMVGARSTKAGNACLYALGAMPGPHGAPQLVRLQRQLKQPSARGRLDATLDTAAAQAGVTRDDLEDQAVPTHGLEAGPLRLPVGPYTVEIAVRGTRQPDVRWLGPDGAALDAEPADARKAHAAAHQQAMRMADEVRKTLAAQRDRLERLLMADRAWRLADWRRLYLDHPLLGVLARPLIWQFTAGERTALGAWLDGRFVDAQDMPLDWLNDDTGVRLWHPIGSPATTVLAWRQWLARHAVTQPFKQAHREVYLLTDAERVAGTESRRFAEHILRQHQLQALCRERGWRYGLQGAFDNADAATPTLELPRWKLRAELDVEPIEERDMVSAHGIFIYTQTESVRFYRLADAPPGAVKRHFSKAALRTRAVQALLSGNVGQHLANVAFERRQLFAAAATPLPLEDVPPVVFSEVMRDVDLFVGVCSVGADPTWLDTAPQRYADYWGHFAFGEVSESAQTRRAVLEELLPQLAIGPRCSLDGRHLVVRGDLRTYRIHLGSASVLMEPNGQYLCIVPKRGPAIPGEPGHVYLPFDGDSVLSLILSKAFLLADDTAIRDPSITRQIRPT